MVAVKTLFWIVIVLVHGMVVVIAPYLLLRANVELVSGELGVFRYLGLAPMVVGAAVVFWSAWHLTVSGKGTPAPFDPPKKLVVRSLYCRMRNPMYSGDLLVLLGETFLFESLILVVYGLLMFGVFHLFIVLYEEPVLKRQFGESYEQYCKQVPRWIPSFRPPEHGNPS